MFCLKIYILRNTSGFAQITQNLFRFMQKDAQKFAEKTLRKNYAIFAQ